MKFVIVGGGGYIGFHIGQDLVSKGHSVLLFDIVPPDNDWVQDQDQVQDGRKKKRGEIPFFKGTLLDVGQLVEAFQKADCVILCASYGMSGKEQLNWDKTEEINIGGAVNVINACVRAQVKGLVYTSTFNVVFGGQEIHNGNEDLPYFPLHRHVDHYSRTKSIAEQLVLLADGKGSIQSSHHNHHHQLRTTALRLAGVMGLKEKRHLPRIVDSLPMLKFTYGDPKSLVQFISIQNVVQAHVKAALGLLQMPEKVGGQAFFVSDGVPINNFTFFRPLIEGLGYSFPSLNLPLPFMWVFSRISMAAPWLIPLLTPAEIFKTAITHYFSNDKARRILGYEPTRPNDLSAVVKYFKEKQKQEQKQSSHGLLLLAIVFFLIAILYFLLFCQ